MRGVIAYDAMYFTLYYARGRQNVYINSATYIGNITPTPDFTQWNRYGFVFNYDNSIATNNWVKIYFNGELVQQTFGDPNILTPEILQNGVFFDDSKTYFARSKNATLGYNQEFDNIKIHRRALTDEEMAPVVDDPILFDIEQWAETQTDYTMDTEYQLGSEPYYFAPLIRYVRMAIDDLTKFPVSGSSFKITVDWQDAVYPNPDLYSWQFGVGHDEYNKHGGFTILVQGTSIYLYIYNSAKTIVKFANLYSIYGQNQNQHYREEIIYESDTLKYTYNHYEGGNMETIVHSSFGYLTENWGYSSEFDTQPKYFLQSTVSGHHFYKLTVETY